MAPKSTSVLFVILSVLVISAPCEASPGGAIVGGWRKIQDLRAPEVVEIAKFAVAEHNKAARTSLSFVRVVEGETQVVSGTNYRLVVAAAEGGADQKNYAALVWYQPWQNRKQLLSFEKTQAMN